GDAMPTIEILDKSDHMPSFDLEEVLAVVQPFSPGLEWYFVELEPVRLVASRGAEDDPPPWVSQLFQEIKKKPSGAKVEWRKVEEFAHHIKQTIDAILIGVQPGVGAPTAPIDPNDPEYDIVIQA